MQFTVDQINENIGIWETMKKEKRQEQILTEKNDENPQPSLEEQSSTSQRSRSGI